MSMILKPRRLDDVVILDLSGRITIGEGTLILRNTFRNSSTAAIRSSYSILRMSTTSTAPAWESSSLHSPPSAIRMASSSCSTSLAASRICSRSRNCSLFLIPSTTKHKP